MPIFNSRLKISVQFNHSVAILDIFRLCIFTFLCILKISNNIANFILVKLSIMDYIRTKFRRKYLIKRCMGVFLVLITAFIAFQAARLLHIFQSPAIIDKPVILYHKQNISENLSWESSKPVKSSVLTIAEIKSKVYEINRARFIKNTHMYGDKQDYSMVIVIQVHSRIEYLKFLISSLYETYDIYNALLIFSHDYYDEDINVLIRGIRFCRVMQIFYPYSIQLHPNEFPGSDPNDCSRDTPMQEAMNKSCSNAFFYDLGGKYRTPKLAQLKNHWWWKANVAFNLEAVKMYNGPVLFLEEDNYVVEDFIYMIKLMYNTTKANCEECKIFSLASNMDSVNLVPADFSKSSQAIMTTIFSTLGVSFDRAAWTEMARCAQEFCTFDDYNWDFSLKFVFTNCMKNSLAVTLRSPRVFHLGECGIHYTNANCNVNKKVTIIRRLLQFNRANFYPEHLIVYEKIDNMPSYDKYGGFADPRDRALCMGVTV